VVHQKKNSFNQGKRRLNGRNIRAQQEDSVRRTVYVSDIDQQVSEFMAEIRETIIFNSIASVVSRQLPVTAPLSY